MLRVLILLFATAVAVSPTRGEERWGMGQGTLSPSSEFPAAGALLSLDADAVRYGAFQCSGTLIAPRAFLTAAHCVLINPDAKVKRPKAASTLRVYFQTAGIYNVTDVLWRSKDYHDYTDTNGDIRSDIAILELDRPVVGVRPMPINTKGTPTAGTEGVVVGFGSVKLVYDYDSRVDRLLKMGVKRKGHVVTSICPFNAAEQGQFVCYGGPSSSPRQAQTCFGDSGGGLYSADATPTVVGITSTGCSYPGHHVDTDVFSYRPWIEAKLATIAAGRSQEEEICGSFSCLTEDDVRSTIDYLIYDTRKYKRKFAFDFPSGAQKVIITINGQVNDDESMASVAAFSVDDSVLACKFKKIGQFSYCEFDHPTPGRVIFPVVAASGSGLFQITASFLRGQRLQDSSASEPSESDEDPYDLWDSDKAPLERDK